MLFLVEGFIRKANPLHKPESNGCGSFGYTVNEVTPCVCWFYLISHANNIISGKKKNCL